MFPHVSVDPPYNHQAPKIQLQSRRDQRSAPQIPSQPTQQIPRTCVFGLHRSPTNQPANPPTSRARPWRVSQPAETSGRSTQIRIQPTYSNSLRRRGGHGYGVASRRCDGAGVAVGPCVQACLKAGSCGADPRGTGAGWTRQKSADAAPDPQDV